MKTALFVDFDNVYSGLRRISAQGAERLARQPAKWLKWLTDELPMTYAAAHPEAPRRRMLVRRCYMNPVLFHQFRRPFHEAGFEIVDCPPMTATGKTSTDIHLVLDTMDTLLDNTHFDEFMVFSADADFSPLLRRLRRHDRRTVVFAAGAMSEAYKASADLVIDIPTFIREGLQLVEASPEPDHPSGADSPTDASRIAELRQRASAAVQRLIQQASAPMSLPALASQLQREVPGLRECQWAGAGTFGALMKMLNPPGVYFSFAEEMAFDQIRMERSRNGLAAASTPSPAGRSEPVESPATLGAKAAATEAEDMLVGERLDQAAVKLIRQRMNSSPRPLHFSYLGSELRETFPQLSGGWNGASTLASYLQRLPLEPLLRAELEDGSTWVLYDPDRHQAPAGIVGDSRIAAMLRAAELPAIRPVDFLRVLHHTRPHLGQHEDFEISTVSRNVSEDMAAEGRPVSARRVAQVLQALIFGGLNSEVALESDDALTATALGVILSAWSRETQVQADDDARQHLVSWLSR